MINRRLGKNEITLNEFIKFEKSKNYFYRLNLLRKEYSKLSWKHVVLNYSNKNYFRCIFYLIITLLMQPIKTIGLIYKKFVFIR